MLVLLPASCFLLIALNLLARRNPGADLRPVLLHAAVVWGVALVAITETLSVLGRLTPGMIAASWALLAAPAGASLLLGPRVALPRRPQCPRALHLLLLLPVAAILAGTALSAIAGWPNQWDSMVYHLSRVDHWLQNRTVDFYPTHIIRQLYNPPGAEYAILHLRALGGDDRWSNAVQWLAMAGSLVGVSAIARTLGAGAAGQLFAALFAATIPMGILQASGTQNDYVVAFWLVCMTEAALTPASAGRTFRIGAGLGLALVSKGTALLFAGPLLLAMPDLLARPWHRQLLRGAAIVLIALALNVPHWARNTATFGGPLGPRNPGSAGEVDDRLTNEAMSPAILASNIVRNLSLHSGTRFERVNRVEERAIRRVHEWLGLAVDDSRSTRLYSERRFAVVGERTNPDRTGNPLHLVLALLAAGTVALSPPLRRKPSLARYTLALAGAFLLFCLALKWQPWHSRLQLPLFVVAAPLAGAVLEGFRRLMLVAAVLLSVAAARPLLRNRLAPLVGRHTVFDTPRLQQYFQAYGPEPNDRQRAYASAAESVRARGCADVGLLLGWDDWEHPLWILLRQGAAPGTPRLEHVGVVGDGAALPRPRGRFVPCAVVVGSVPAGDTIRLEGRTYRSREAGNRLTVFHYEEGDR